MSERSDRAAAILAALPPGTVELGRRHLGLAERRLDGMSVLDCSSAAVEAHLVRPIELADEWPDPTDPLPIGEGAIHADLIDDDRELFGALRETLSTDSVTGLDAETLATEAQACRLAVTPYRRRCRSASSHAPARVEASASIPPGAVGPRGVAPPEARVVDLSALWAGPLATALLAKVGAEVIKVDPSCRPDAFAEHPRLYEHLNHRKEIVDLDLRVDDDRRRFEALVASADLVVDSFSRRVMPNLGYGPKQLRRLAPHVRTLSIRAFEPSSPQADWVAYGPGVHAMSGLAEQRPVDGRRAPFRPAPIAYPDAVAGMSAFAVAVELLADSGQAEHRTVALSTTIAPLLSVHDG
ncbi:MAG: CoA transferase [Acidimicrobiales bacterium]